MDWITKIIKFHNMHLQDARIALFNGLTFLVSFSNVEQWLKIILLVASIVYTVLKIVEMHKKNESNK